VAEGSAIHGKLEIGGAVIDELCRRNVSKGWKFPAACHFSDDNVVFLEGGLPRNLFEGLL
jgi:hypothetical protein